MRVAEGLATVVCVLLEAGLGWIRASRSFSALASTQPFHTFVLTVSLVLLGTNITLTTFSDGCLGSNNDEGRSEMR